MKSGFFLSGTAHGLLISFLVANGVFFMPERQYENLKKLDIMVLSEAEFDAMASLPPSIENLNINEFQEPKNFIDLYTTISTYFETLTEQEAEELWKSIEDCALKYNLWGVADEAQFEDPIQTSKELDRALFIANCFREEGYEKVPDPNYFNRDVNLDAYIDENWELREDDPLVQTWQGCEEKLPEELKEEWDD